jgi:hypothetical protein
MSHLSHRNSLNEPSIECMAFGALGRGLRSLARVLLGRKSPGCPAGVYNEISASKVPPHEVVSSGIGRPTFPLGKAEDIVEETDESTRCTAGVGDPASKNRLLEITSGSCRGQQGLVTTCKDSPNEAKSRRREPNGSGG